MPGLTDLRVTAEKGGEVSFTAVSTAGADLRGALCLALAEAGCPVLSLSADTMSLEDVFLQITETAPRAPDTAGRKRLPHAGTVRLPNRRKPRKRRQTAMTAIFKREVKSYFTGMIGWVIAAVSLFFIGCTTPPTATCSTPRRIFRR